MIGLATVLFLLAAVGGLYMATRIFANAFPPPAIAVVHGLAAATALVITIVAAMQAGAQPLVKYAAGLMFGAALGGFLLLSFHVRKVSHPKGVVVVHALVAVAGVACLLMVLAGK